MGAEQAGMPEEAFSVSSPNTFVESKRVTNPHGLLGPLMRFGPANDKKSNAPQPPNDPMRALDDSTREHPKQVRNGFHRALVRVMTKPVQHNS